MKTVKKCNTTLTVNEVAILLEIHKKLLGIACDSSDLRLFLKESISVETLTELLRVFEYKGYSEDNKYYLVPEDSDSVMELYNYLKQENRTYILASAFA